MIVEYWSYYVPSNGKVSAQPHTIVRQICFPNGNVLFLSLFPLFKNWMHNVGWGCTEILPLKYSWLFTLFLLLLLFFFTPGGDKSYIRSSEGERGKVYIVYVFNHSLYFSKLHITQFTEVKIGIQVIHSTPSSVKLQYFECVTDLALRINHASVK